MVFLELVKIDGDEVTYNYMPESKSAACGVLSVNRVTGERTLHAKSSDGELPWYRSHAWQHIDEMLSEGKLEEQAVATWY